MSGRIGTAKVWGARLLWAMLLGMIAGTAWAQAPAPNPPGPALSPVTPLPTTPANPSGTTPSAPPPAASSPAPSMSPTPAPKSDGSVSTEDHQPSDGSIKAMDLPTHPAVTLSGQATWDNGFASINDSFDKLRDAMAKAKIGETGHPLAVFTSTDDSGFHFTAMLPIDKVPDGKPDLGGGIAFGETPGGKVLRFQHRASYDDIDSTYEAITAYLDQKGLDSKVYAEEYLHPVKESDDNSLEVDIYVFLK